jgi:hypothetical protein
MRAPKREEATQTCLHARFLLGLFSDPEDGGDIFFEKSVEFQQTTWHYISEDRTLQMTYV